MFPTWNPRNLRKLREDELWSTRKLHDIFKRDQLYWINKKWAPNTVKDSTIYVRDLLKANSLLTIEDLSDSKDSAVQTIKWGYAFCLIHAEHPNYNWSRENEE